MIAAVHRGRLARQGHEPDKGNLMHQLDLPLHPTARHPRTGQPLRAIAVRPGHDVPLGLARAQGRAKDAVTGLLDAMLLRHFVWPIMGASPDDPADGGKDDGGKDDGDKSGGGGQTDPPPAQRQPGVPPNYAIDGNGASLGYPVNTPTAEMKAEEQAAYFRVQQRKHEQRATAWKQAAGDRDPAKLQADLDELETLRREKMTDQERREADAEKRGEQKVTSTVSTTFAAQLLGVALAHVEDDRRKVLVEGANLSSFVNPDGTVDADKVTKYAETLAPKSGKDNQRDPDYGAGRRGSSTSTGLEAGRTAYQERQAAKKARGSRITAATD